MPKTLNSARPASLPSMNGYRADAGQLGAEQDRRGLAPREREHARTVARGSV